MGEANCGHEPKFVCKMIIPMKAEGEHAAHETTKWSEAGATIAGWIVECVDRSRQDEKDASCIFFLWRMAVIEI